MVRRVSGGRERYFAAGLDLLGERGPEALTLAAVCGRVGTTKGSFYHHFASLDSWYRAMLDHWASWQTAEPVITPDALDARARLTWLRQMAVFANHETEVAIRAWASWYEPAALAHRRVERHRRELLTRTFVELGIDRARAATLARVGTTLMAGVQSDVDKVDRSVLDEVLSEYQRWIEASLSHGPDDLARGD
jgi:AcrR family transcriptional regulator